MTGGRQAGGTRLRRVWANRRRLVRPCGSAILLVLAGVPLACTGKHPAPATPASVPSDTEVRAPGERRVVAFTQRPEILNKTEIVRAMQRNYPPELRDRGIGGTVRLRVFVDEHGIVRDSQISRSSGNALLDAAALKVIAVYRFSPALNHGEPVAAWIFYSITFRVRDP